MASDFEDFPADDLAGAHMNDFRVAEDDGDDLDADFLPVGEDGEVMDAPTEPEQMPRAAFRATFETAWNLPGMMLPDYKPLQITDEKQGHCNEAADALYDLAELHFPAMLNQQNSTIAAVGRLIPFGLIQAGAFRAIMQEKRRAKLEAANSPQEPRFASRRGSPPQEPATAAPAGGNSHGWMDQEAQAA